MTNGNTPYECIVPTWAAADFWYLKEGLGPREYYAHPPWYALQEGIAQGILLGGNLDSLISLIGTAYLPNFNSCILLIETSINENPGRFDRQMMQLRHTGIFDQIAGLIIGQFAPKSILSQLKVIKDIVERAIKPNQFPVMINGSFSHVDPLLSLPIGGRIKLNTEKTFCKITIMDSIYE